MPDSSPLPVSIQTVTIGIPVTDLSVARQWYGALLAGRPTISPIPTITEYELTTGCWLQLVESAEVAIGDATVRIGVLNLEAECARLKAVGIETDSIQRIEGLMLRCGLADPYGRKLSMYQLL